MTDWSRFPTFRITPETRLWRIHNADAHPAYFNDSDSWRFGPPPTHKGKYRGFPPQQITSAAETEHSQVSLSCCEVDEAQHRKKTKLVSRHSKRKG